MKLYSSQRFAIAMASFVMAVGLIIISLKISPSISYTDFIAGHITWTGGTKFQDLIVMPVTIIGTALFSIFLCYLFGEINKSAKKSDVEDTALQISYWSIPAFATICSAILHNGYDPVFFAVSFIGVSGIITLYLIAIKKNKPINAEVISVGLVCIFFLALTPLNIAIIAKFFPTFFQSTEALTGKTIGKLYASCLLAFLLGYILLLALGSRFPFKLISILVLLGQLSLPLLYLSLYPEKILAPDGNITSYRTGVGLKIIIIGLILASFIDVIYRYIKYSSSDTLSVKSLSPLAICALLVTLKAGATIAPNIPTDDYHFGEYLLGWWVYLQGYIPYVDYIPAHGLINNDLSGMLNFVFYDGTAGSLGEAQRFTLYLLSIIAFLAVYSFTGNLLWAFLSIYFLGARITWLFFIPFITLWFNRSLIEDKVKWSVIWFVTAPIVILGVPPQGLLLVAASGVIPLYFLWNTLTNRNWTPIKHVAIAAASVTFFYMITPLGSMLFQAINYVLLNGPVNQAAYGIPWSISFPSSNLLMEVTRMSWILVPFISLVFLYLLYKKKNTYAFLVLPLCVTFIFSILLVPYSMGRIDPGALSRPGIVAILLIAGVLGLAMWHLLNRYERVLLFFGVTFCASLLKFSSLSHSPLLNTSTPLVHSGHLIDTKNTSLKNIGFASMDNNHWIRINKLNTLLNQKLSPQESYLDLTSRNAQYFYLNRKPVIPVTAPYNMVSYKQQFDAIALLNEKLPRLALLEGDNIVHDGGGLAIRNHYFYRFLLERYEPFEENGFIIGLSKESITRDDWENITIPSQMEKMALFEKAFSQTRRNLEKLPNSWGKSIHILEKNMTPVYDLNKIIPQLHDLVAIAENNFSVKGGDPFSVYDTDGLSVSGKSAGLLKFDFECKSKLRTPILQIFWWGDGQTGAHEESSIFFSASNGTVIVPLDSSPRWLLLNQIKGIRIDLSDPVACSDYKIHNLTLYQRNLVTL